MGQRDAAKQFAIDWNGRGNEKSDSQNFWRALLSKVFDIKEPEKFIQFEKPVSFDSHTHFIDAYIPSTKVLIEQKSLNKNLDDEINSLTPFNQALRYAENLNYGERPRWIVTCNFAEFRIYYAQKFFFHYEIAPPVIVKLENLPDEFDRLNFLVDPDDTTILEDVNISRAAISVIKKFRDEVAEIYQKKNVPHWEDFIYKICVRLVFCFYADDSRLFDDDKKYFTTYLQNFKSHNQIDALQKIFNVLNTPVNLRGNVDEDLNNFPYVNGGLFDEVVTLPNFQNLLPTPIDNAFLANINIHWEKIDPPIFGALFESALDPNTQRQGGMHYTSVENIHKVIAPLFLNKLKADFSAAKGANMKNRLQKLIDFQNDLASLTFLDPACGSGNFLTETYRSIRALENETIREMNKIDNSLFNQSHPVKVSINNFFGIEIHQYAVAVAQLAMWIVEHQMLHKTEIILHKDLNPLPLKNYPNIICANALQIDWANIVPRDKLSFIIGNPPFVGYTYQTPEQKADLLATTKLKTKKLDYVVSWYYKAADFIKGTKIQCAFVSTNSICQGEQVGIVWKNLPVKIKFAYRTFKWISESANMAAVHCVIISFAMNSRGKKIIYDGEKEIVAKNINAYLYDAPNIYIESRTNQICNAPKMNKGSMPADGGNLIVEVDEYDKFNAAEKNFIRPFIGAEEFINGKRRYCLWLVGISSNELDNLPNIKKRVDAVKNFRLKSKKSATREDAKRPTEFQEIRQPSTNYLLVPRVSSENRRYIPIGFLSSEIIASDAVHIIPNATLYHFGVLTSSVHMAWTRVVCGRLEMRYRYSKDIVYNNFVWCSPTDAQKKLIEETAQKILTVRAEFDGKTLAYLYNESTMPVELRLAHMENDAAVMAAYGFDENLSESEIVAALMELHKKMTM